MRFGRFHLFNGVGTPFARPQVICIILVGSITSTAVMRGFLSNKVLFKATCRSGARPREPHESRVRAGVVSQPYRPIREGSSCTSSGSVWTL